jgi:hypothetical protein
MLVPFDVDCGYLMEGHRFIARGIVDKGTMSWDGTGAFPSFSLDYELVPGITEDEGHGGLFWWLVGIEYQSDVALPWTPNDSGAIAPARGGASTHGSRGDWPLPREATVLRFVLTGVGASGSPHSEPDGVLTVDLRDETAVWEPT